MKFPPCSERNGELGDGQQAKKKKARSVRGEDLGHLIYLKKRRVLLFLITVKDWELFITPQMQILIQAVCTVLNLCVKNLLVA